jgi:hypothetical protein
MKSGVRAVCRLLIASMMFLSFHMAHAGMIGTEQVLATAQSERAHINSLLARSDIQNQLQMLGVSPAAAKDRVAAMTDQEVRALAGHLESVPAGGISGWVVVLIIAAVLGFLWWRGGLRL